MKQVWISGKTHRKISWLSVTRYITRFWLLIINFQFSLIPEFRSSLKLYSEIHFEQFYPTDNVVYKQHNKYLEFSLYSHTDVSCFSKISSCGATLTRLIYFFVGIIICLERKRYQLIYLGENNVFFSSVRTTKISFSIMSTRSSAWIKVPIITCHDETEQFSNIIQKTSKWTRERRKTNANLQNCYLQTHFLWLINYINDY